MKFEEVVLYFRRDGISRDCVRRFLEAGGDVNHRHPEDGRTLLHFAAEDLNEPALQLLVSHGADLDLPDSSGERALHVAVDMEMNAEWQFQQPCLMAMAGFLIRSGAREDLSRKDGRTARDIALVYGQNAMDLYDSVSRLDDAGEASVIRFCKRLNAILNASGSSSMILHRTQLSVAKSSSLHWDLRRRLLLSAEDWFDLKHDPDLIPRLKAFVAAALTPDPE